MVAIFQLLVHVVLLMAAVGMLALIALLIYKSPENDLQEIIMRGMACASGLLIYMGAKALGLSIPDLMFQAMGTSFLVVPIVGILLPALAGVALTQYVIGYLRSRDALKNRVGMRIMTLIMTLVFFLYTDAYILSFDVSSQNKIQFLLPNLTFVLSVLLYAVFKYHPLELFAGGHSDLPRDR